MKLLVIAFISLLLCNCASIKIDESTGKYEYSRWGNQELHGITINVSKKADGSMKLESSLNTQKSEREIAEVITEALKVIDRAVTIIQNLESRIPGL